MYRFFRVTLPAYRAALSSSSRGFSTIVGTPKTRTALLPSTIEGQSLLYRLNTTSPSYAASLGPVRTFFWRKKKGSEEAEQEQPETKNEAGKQDKTNQQPQTTTTQSSEPSSTSAATDSDKFQTFTRTGVTVLTKPATRAKVSFDKRQVKQQKADLQKNAIKQRRIDNLAKKKAAEAESAVIPPAPTQYVNPKPSPPGYIPVSTIQSIEQAEGQLQAWYQTTANVSGKKMFPFNPYPLKRLISLSHARVAEIPDNKEEIEAIAKNVEQWVKKLLYTRAVTLDSATVSPLLDFFCDKAVGQIDIAVDLVRSSVLNPKKVIIVTHPRQQALEGGKKIVRVKGVLMKAADAEKELPEQANLEVKPYLRLFHSVSTMERLIGALFATGQTDTALELFVDFFDTPITLETEGDKKPKKKTEFALKPTKDTYSKLCRALAQLSAEPRYYELFKLSAEQFFDLTQNDKKTQIRTAAALIDGSLRSKDLQNLEGYLQKISQEGLSASQSVSVLKMSAVASIALGKTDEAAKAIAKCPKEARTDMVKSLVQYVALLDGLAPPAGAEAGEKLLDQTKAFISGLVSSNPDLSLPEQSQIDSWATASQ